MVEGLAAINFQLSDVNGPIEVDGQTTYEVKVTNQGSKAASNLRLVALLPRANEADLGRRAGARSRGRPAGGVRTPQTIGAQGRHVVYDQGPGRSKPGDLRVQVQLATDEIREPITKEESTRVDE